MIIILLRQLKLRLLTVFIACLVLLVLCWSVPVFYGFLTAEGEEEYERLDDPVRVERSSDGMDKAAWIRAFGN